MKRQQTMFSFLSNNKRSRRVAGKLYNNFRGKQNKAYVLAMKKQPIAMPEIIALSFALPTVQRTRGDKATLHREILLEMYSRQRFKRSLENNILQQRKRSGLETIITQIQQSDAIFVVKRSVADTADFPVIRHVSDTKDTEYHPKLAGDHFTL